NLFLLGMEMETLLKIKASAPADADRNPQMDADLLHAAHSLLIAHAGLIMLFPDAKQTTVELDQYRENLDGIETLRQRVLEPVLIILANNKEIFDESTNKITEQLKEEQGSIEPFRGIAAARHGWLRGALGAMGEYILRTTRDAIKIGR